MHTADTLGGVRCIFWEVYMFIRAIGSSRNYAVHYYHLLAFSTLRLKRGTSRSLLNLRLQYRTMHLNNHFPYTKTPSYAQPAAHSEALYEVQDSQIVPAAPSFEEFA